MEIDNIDFLTNQETFHQDSGYIRSAAWLDFRRMLIRDPNVLIENLVWCIHCKEMVPYLGTTTTRLLEHSRKCKDRPLYVTGDGDGEAKITFKLNELKQLRDAAAKFVVKDLRPFVAVEGDGLLDFLFSAVQLGLKHPQMNKADLRKAIGTRNTCMNRVRELGAAGTELITRKIRHSIQVCGKFAVTADLWTEPHMSNNFLGVTVHFFTVEEAAIKLEAFTAEMREIQEMSTTGRVVQNAIYDVLGGIGVTDQEVRDYMHLVTDRGSNMLSAASAFDSSACVAHLFNNVISHMVAVPEMNDIVSKASSLVRYMKTSHAAALMVSRLKSFPETRFNYIHDMLYSIKENYQETFDILMQKEAVTRNPVTDKITCLSVDELKHICDFLCFFKEVTNAIEGEKYVTLNKVWPVLRELRSVLEPKLTDIELITQMKFIGREYIAKPENEKYFNPSEQQKLALFLHPQMNQLSFLNFRGMWT